MIGNLYDPSRRSNRECLFHLCSRIRDRILPGKDSTRPPANLQVHLHRPLMASLQSQLELINWVRDEDGFFHQNVEVAHSVERGFFVRVRNGESIRSGTRIASCPMSVALSILNVMDVEPFECHGTKFPASFINQHPVRVVQSFFLMEQYVLASKSWWACYLSALPGPHEIDTLHFSNGNEDDLKWIAGTNLKSALVCQNEEWRQMYTVAVEHLKRLKWYSAMQGHYTWYVVAILDRIRSLTDAPKAAVPVGCYHFWIAKLLQHSSG